MRTLDVTQPIEEPISNRILTLRGETHGISLVDPGVAVLRDLVIDCSRVPRGYDAHGIRVTGKCSGLLLERVTIIRSPHYGFGFQRVHCDAPMSIVMRDCIVVSPDADGVDLKVMSQPELGMTSAIERCTFIDCPVGVDIRGSSVITMSHFDNCKKPIRFRPGDDGTNGIEGSGLVESSTYRRKKPVAVKTKGAGPVMVSGWDRV